MNRQPPLPIRGPVLVMGWTLGFFVLLFSLTSHAAPKCWVKMKTGCSNPRANIEYPRINQKGWVKDWHGSKKGRWLCLKKRRRQFNQWCRRNNAQIHWGEHPPLSKKVTRTGRIYQLPVRFMGICKASPAGSKKYLVWCGRGPKLRMTGTIGASGYDLKSVGRLRLASIFEKILKRMVLKTAPRKAAYMRYPLQGLRWLLRGINIRQARIGLNDSYGYYVSSQIQLGGRVRGNNFVAKVFNNMLKAMRFMLGGKRGRVQMDIVGDISNGELVVKPIIQLVQHCTSRKVVIPKIGTAFQYKGLLLTLYFKRDLAGFDIEAELRGEFYTRLTKAKGDGWIKLEPIVSIDKSAQIRLGGRFYGLCSETFACRRRCNCSCTGKWSPFGIRPISAQGGRLTVVFDSGGKPVAMDASILKADLAGVKLTGAINIDPTRYKFGLYLKRNKVPFHLPLYLLGQLKGLRKIIPRGLYIKDFELKISPTGGNVGPVDYSKPGLRIKGKVNTLGFQGSVDAQAGLDLDGLSRGKLNRIGSASFAGSLSLRGFNREVRKALTKIPGLRLVVGAIMKEFQFNHVAIATSLVRHRVKAFADVSFRVFGKNVRTRVQLAIALDPKKLAPYIAKYCKRYGIKLGKLILRGGKYIVKGAKYISDYAVKGTLIAGRAVGKGVGTAARATAKTGKAVGRSALSGAKAFGAGAFSTGKKVSNAFLSAGKSVIGIFKKKWSCGWLCHGLGFHPLQYLNHNPDVVRVYGRSINAAQRHWKKHGFWERRRSAFYFDMKYYIRKNPDVKRAFGNNIKKIYVHWIENGLKEGRQGSADFSPKFYLNYYKDVARHYGATNYAGAIHHWLHWGRKEGRRTVSRPAGWRIGKFYHGACIVAYRGREYAFRRDLDILTGHSARWVKGTKNHMLRTVTSAGYRVCRVFHHGAWQPGFFVRQQRLCHYTWGGRKRASVRFQVLVGRGSRWLGYHKKRTIRNVIIGGKKYGFALCRPHP